MLSGLRKQDGEAVAFLILVSTHEEEKQKHHSLEESYVITKEFFLVERVERDKFGIQERWTRRRAETVKVLKNNGSKKAKKESRWKDVTKDVHEAGLHIKERKCSGIRAAEKAR